MSNVTHGDLADLMVRARALELRVIQLQQTIDTLRVEAQACIAARERELDLLAACETD
ncbi:MAG: hypothetical protein KF708_16780 [Pirellulales bacterium]|nr:hypothetical protein [Pirellulales bacterium]